MSYEVVNNIALIGDSIDHINYELNGKRNLVRIAVEGHQILLRSMVQALRGSNNLTITGKRPKHWLIWDKISNDPYKIVEKQPIPGCQSAWRFSDPRPCEDPPELDNRPASIERLLDKHLHGFYDFLALVQTECEMSRYVMSKPIFIPDSEMQVLEWLHEDVRNAVEHFVPSSLLVERDGLRQGINICLKYSVELFYDSNTFFLDEEEKPVRERLKELEKVCVSELPYSTKT